MQNKRPAQIKINKNSEGVTFRVDSSPNKDEKLSPSEAQSPSLMTSRKKNKQLILTKKTTSNIQQAHQQILHYIDFVDQKMVKHVQKQESQFLIAYRNHVKRMREEMQQIRNKSINNANTQMNQTQKIEFLQKQLVLFRQQSLSLFDKMQKKQKMIDLLEKRIKTLQCQNYSLNENMKKTTKRNKYLEGQLNSKVNTQLKFSKTDRQSEFQQSNNNQNTFRPFTTALNKNRMMRIRNNSVQLSNHRTQRKNIYYSQQISELTLKLDHLLGNQKQIIRDQIKNQIQNFLKSKSLMDRFPPSSRGSAFKKTQNKSLMQKMIKNKKQRQSSKKAEMQNYFSICVDTVRKQICRRKGIKTLNFFNQHKSITFEQFKKLDFFRLLQLIVYHQKVINVIYKTLF